LTEKIYAIQHIIHTFIKIENAFEKNLVWLNN